MSDELRKTIRNNKTPGKFINVEYLFLVNNSNAVVFNFIMVKDVLVFTCCVLFFI
jgi:hypothetical protein